MQVNERNVYAPNGNFSFDGSETGSDIADFLLGAPASYTQASFQVLDSRTKYGAAFAQDSWRVTPNLTINYGVRWEVSMPWYDTQNKIETIVPGQQSTRISRERLRDGFSRATRAFPPRWRPPRGTISPRAWGLPGRPTCSAGILGKLFGGPGKTSIRAAAGHVSTPRFRTPAFSRKWPTRLTACSG